jgi:hypothetical protein
MKRFSSKNSFYQGGKKQTKRNIMARTVYTRTPKDKLREGQLTFAQHLLKANNRSRATPPQPPFVPPPCKRQTATARRGTAKKMNRPHRRQLVETQDEGEGEDEDEGEGEEPSGSECKVNTKYLKLGSLCAKLAGHFYEKAKDPVAEGTSESVMDEFEITASNILAHFGPEELVRLGVTLPDGHTCEVEVKQTNTIMTLKTVLAQTVGVPASRQSLLVMPEPDESSGSITADHGPGVGGSAHDEEASSNAEISPSTKELTAMKVFSGIHKTPLENYHTIAQSGLSNNSSLLLIVESEYSSSVSDEELEPEVPELEAVIAAGYPEALSKDIPLATLLPYVDVSKLSLQAEFTDTDESDDDDSCVLPKAAKLVLLINNECVSDLVRESSYFKQAARQSQQKKILAKVGELEGAIGEHEVQGLHGERMFLLKLSPDPDDCVLVASKDRSEAHANIQAKLLLRPVSRPSVEPAAAVVVHYTCRIDRNSGEGCVEISAGFYPTTATSRQDRPIQQFGANFRADGDEGTDFDDLNIGRVMADYGFVYLEDEGEDHLEQVTIANHLVDQLRSVFESLWCDYGQDWY